MGGPHRIRPELLAMLLVDDPSAGSLDEFPGDGGGKVPNDRDEIPAAPDLDLEDREAVLGVVVGHPLDGALHRPGGCGSRAHGGIIHGSFRCLRAFPGSLGSFAIAIVTRANLAHNHLDADDDREDLMCSLRSRACILEK